MGWGSAVHIFDHVIKDTKEVLQELHDDYSDHFSTHEMLVKIASSLARELEAGDWDTQQDSDYFEELKWDVFPQIAADLEEELRLYGD